MKIRELFTFDPIQPVIKINDIKDEKEMIKNFVISKNLEEHFLYFLKYLNGEQIDENISVNIIGNYGTGKSHFLAFLSLILSKPELREYIQNERIKEEFSKIQKEFLVVKYELGQNLPLAEIFYYRVKKQLKENYGIDIREIDYKTEKKDPKELIEEIMFEIKNEYPTKGLIVIFDEYSDFIKQKESNDQQFDLNFTRQLAESSSNHDFILMLSMQEAIFKNPEYQANANLINKIKQRFLEIYITSENIEDILAKRMLKKDGKQVQKIKKLFETLKPKFQNISAEEDRYVDLFPVHPYVIEVFSKITFFENRSILQFISNEVGKILDNDFPEFITYDLIYDSMIESEHTVKNKEEVKPVVDVVKSLKDIVNRLDSKYKNNAIRLIESLAIKNLITPPDKKGEKIGGDTPEKFAENLFIIPKSQLISPVDDVGMILNMLIKESVGQFINKDKESNVYYINLNATTDYEQIINNKASNIGDLTYINEKFVEEFLLDELGIEYEKDISFWDSSKKYVLNDSVKWRERNSFRNGLFIIDIGNKLKLDNNNDFIIALRGYGKYNGLDSDILIRPKYSDEFSESLKRLVAVSELIKEHTYAEIMNNKKRIIIDEELKVAFKKTFLKSTINFAGKDYALDDIGISSEINSEIFSQIKEKLLGEKLTEKYPKYPRFKSKLSDKNILGTLDSVIKDIPDSGAVKNLLNQSTNILIPLGMYKENMLDINGSEYAQTILEKIDDNSKNLDIEEIIKEFSLKPYGIQKEIVWFILAILLRNGNIMISSSHGENFSSADFGNLFKKGLKRFEEIKYIKKEEGIPPQTEILFNVLDLDKSLLQLKKNHNKAFQEYISKIEYILEDINYINDKFNEITNYNYLPLDEIDEKLSFINGMNFSKLKINSLPSFKLLDYSSENIDKIKEAYHLIHKLKSLFKDLQDYIIPGINYMENVKEWTSNDFFRDSDKKELENIHNDSLEIIKDVRKLLKEDERNPLKGKIEQFKEKYKTIYYNTHEDYVGENVDWKLLSDLKESHYFYLLNILKDTDALNSSQFRSIQLKIMNLEKLKCNNFRVEELNNSYHCVCMFPKNLENSENKQTYNINKQIENFQEEIENLYKSWTKQILDDIQDKKENINLLDPEDLKIIENILDNGELPDTINENTVNAINNLLKDIQIEDINIQNLFDTITQDKDTLKVDELKNKLNDYIEEKTRDFDKNQLRIRITRDNGD